MDRIKFISMVTLIYNLKLKSLQQQRNLQMSQLQQKYKIQSMNEQQTFMRAVSLKDEKEVAIKKVRFANMSEKDKKAVTEQVNLLRGIKSNHIVKYYDYILDKPTASLYVIMQYCSGESLQRFLELKKQDKTFIDEKSIWKIFSQIVSAINEIHNDPQGAILHRDIQPKNILLTKDNTVKLGNFSLLRRLSPEEQFSKTYISGTYYRSPQQIQSGIYSTESDIWALGCLLYEMAMLKSPFKKNSEFLTSQCIVSQKNVESIPNFYSSQLKRVINWCLQKKRENRPTATMLKNIPQINYRIRRTRLTDISRASQEKEQKIAKKQEIIKKMEERIAQLQALQYLQEEKQNNPMQNILRYSNSLCYKE